MLSSQVSNSMPVTKPQHLIVSNIEHILWANSSNVMPLFSDLLFIYHLMWKFMTNHSGAKC